MHSERYGDVTLHRIEIPAGLDESDAALSAYLADRSRLHWRFIYLTGPFWLGGILATWITARWLPLVILIGLWLLLAMVVAGWNHKRLQRTLRAALALEQIDSASDMRDAFERVTVRRHFLRRKFNGDAPAPTLPSLLKDWREIDSQHGQVFYFAGDVEKEPHVGPWQELREPVVIQPWPWTLILLLTLALGVGAMRDWDWLWMINVALYTVAYLVFVWLQPRAGARYWFVPGGYYEQLSVWRGSRVRYVAAADACLAVVLGTAGKQSAEVQVVQDGEVQVRLDLNHEQLEEVLGAWLSSLTAPRPEALG